MVVYCYKTKEVKEIQPEEYRVNLHLRPDQMSQRQRRAVIGGYIKLGQDMKDYLKEADTEPVKAVHMALKAMIKGTIPLNLVVLMVLLKKVEEELAEFEEPHH